MAFYGTNPTGGYFKMTPQGTEPAFPGTYGPGDKEGTFYFNDGTGTITSGLYVFQGTAFASITPNVDASSFTSGQLPPDRGGVPVGTIIAWAGASTGTGTAAPPTGYILCNGGTPGGTGAYAALYAAIVNKWGGTDAATMRLPDLRGQFLRGVDHGAGVDPDASTRTAKYTGGNTGDNVGSYQDDAYETHTHGYTAGTGTRMGDGYTWHNEVQNLAAKVSTAGTGTSSTETRPDNVYVEFYIKYIST
jgi:microcystin-dependent protein